MSSATAIEWTNATWNPVTGCDKVGAGCDNCYAERLAERFRGVAGHPFERGFDLQLRPERLGQPLSWRRPRMIFVNSMGDLFHKGVPRAFVDDVFDVMERADRHVFQLLTKRSSRMRDYVNARYRRRPAPAHVWMGVSIEDATKLARARHLQGAAARVRFLSLEPLLGPLDGLDLDGIDWVIVGGESGPRARPMKERWALDVRDACEREGVAFFFKQWGGPRPKSGGRLLDGREWSQWPGVTEAVTAAAQGQTRRNGTTRMTAPKTTTWDIEPHTRAKHAILQRYLQAWTAILASGGFPEILYIDGFAGPGRYSKGEDGSPVIALRAALDLPARDRAKAKVRFLFVEKDAARARALKGIVDGIDVPGNFRVDVAAGETFEVAIRRLLDSYTAGGGRPPPIFAFIDPFGWTGFSFSIVREIMRYRSCEVFVTFMYEEINRFIGHPDQEKNFDALFGTEDWREGVRLADSGKRNRFLHDLYQRQLRNDAGTAYVRSFEMRNERDVVDYYLFYATNNMTGLKKMKEAMWRVDEAGEFRFSDATNPNQAVLFEYSPDFDALRRQIRKRFDGQETTVEEIEEFVLTETAFRETHYKRWVLKPLESAGVVEAIDPSSERKSGTYGDKSLRLRFRRGSP